VFTGSDLDGAFRAAFWGLLSIGIAIGVVGFIVGNWLLRHLSIGWH
jgi:hypothetical protein